LRLNAHFVGVEAVAAINVVRFFWRDYRSDTLGTLDYPRLEGNRLTSMGYPIYL